MFEGLKKRLDQAAIRVACGTLPEPRPRPGQLGEAEALLHSGALFQLPARPARVHFTEGRGFHFDSAIELPLPETNRVRGQLFGAGPDWREKPLLLLIHGWNAELQYKHAFPLMARSLVRRGVNAAMFYLPLHGARRPRQGRIRNMISDDIPMMLRATQQALADIESLLLWARGQGSPALGLWGFSFGAWLAGLHLCASPLQNMAVLTTPVADMEEAIRELAFCAPIRAALGGASLDLSPLNLASHTPRMPPSNILLTESVHDQFVSAGSLRTLEERWGHPEYWRVNHSHTSVLLSLMVLRRTVDWSVGRLV